MILMNNSLIFRTATIPIKPFLHHPLSFLVGNNQ